MPRGIPRRVNLFPFIGMAGTQPPPSGGLLDLDVIARKLAEPNNNGEFRIFYSQKDLVC